VAQPAAAQRPDGYLNSYIQVTGKPRYANLAYSHELYCAGRLIQAGIAAQRSLGDTGQSPLFGVARRFADQLVKEFLGTQDGLDGHPIVETALIESGNYGAVNYGLLLAGAVIAMIPCIVVYVSLQRFYVRGLVSGALKG
jgi:DUF1680 family protein